MHVRRSGHMAVAVGGFFGGIDAIFRIQWPAVVGHRGLMPIRTYRMVTSVIRVRNNTTTTIQSGEAPF